MQQKKQKQTKPLLVLGAVATLSSQLSTDLAIIAYASSSHQTLQATATSQTKTTRLTAIQNDRYRYDLTDLTTQTLPNVQIGKGSAGQTLKESFIIKKNGTTHLNFNLTLAGPTDSQVIVKINGTTYLNQTVGRGQLAEASFFLMKGDEDALVEIEYTVGNGEEVLSGQPWLEFSNMVANSQVVPTRPLEYRVKGETEWIPYDTNKGIEALIETKEDSLLLEVRYTDVENSDIFELTIQAPRANNPLLLVEKDGLFYLNHFNTAYNSYQELSVRFNNGEWQAYKPGMVLELIDNECLVDVKVVNEYGVETLLPTQRYQFPALKQAVMSETDGVITLTSSNIKELNTKIEYQLNGGEWTTYDGAFTPTFEAGQAELAVRISDIYGRTLEPVRYSLTAPQPETLVTSNPQATIKPSISKIEHYFGAFRTHDRIRFGVWVQDNGGAAIALSEWSINGVDWYSFSHTIDVAFTTPGDHTLFIRTTNEDGVVSEIYEHPLTVVEAVAPVISELTFKEPVLYVGADFEPTYLIQHEEDTFINHFVWGGDYDTMFDSPGEKTITLQVQDNRGLWSNEMSYTFTVEADRPTDHIVQPSSYQIEHYYGAFRTHDTIRFGVRVQDHGSSPIVSNEWSINGVDWTPFNHTIDVKFLSAGDQALYLRTRYEDGTISKIYEYPLTIVEAKAPKISDLLFEETDLYVGADFEPFYTIQYEEGTTIDRFVWGGDYETLFDYPGEKTITLQVQDNRGLWSNEISHTVTVRDVKAPVIQGVIPSQPDYLEGDTIQFDFIVDYDPAADFQTVEWLSGYPLSNQAGTHSVTFRIQDSLGNWSNPFTYTYEVKQRLVDPTLSFSNDVLQVPYGSELTAIYKKGVTVNAGSATNVKYAAYKDTFNPKKLGKQKVKYLVKFTQNGVEKRQYVYRYIEVLPQDPTLTFSSNVLKVPYGSELTAIYKKGVTVNAGSATNVKYAAYKDTFNPKKLGKQKVKYLIKYTQNGVEKRQYVYRYIEVTPVNPTLTFSKKPLSAKYGQTPNFNTGVTVNKGSATNVKYSVVKRSYDPKKRGTQNVKYQLTYTQNGKNYKTIVERPVIVK